MRERGAFDYDELRSAISELRARQVFFVCGAVKSGTTWLQLLLDAHPEVSCNGEGHFADRLDPMLAKGLDEFSHVVGAKNRFVFTRLQGYPLVTEDHRLYLLASAISLLLCEQSKGKNAIAIGEKTPDNIRYLDLLNRLFPEARFIHIVRDGRDCAVSCWFHNLRLFRERTQQEFGSIDPFAASFADTWAREVGGAVRFGEARPDRFLALRYEDLIADGANAARKLFAFLGVACGQDVAEKCLAAASFEQWSDGRKPGEEDRNSFFRKGTPGEWRRALGDATKQVFLEKAGHWLTHFDYESL